MWRNGPFKRLLLGFVLSSTGLAVMSPLYIFFIEFVLEEPQGNVIYMLLINYVASMIGIPFWVWLSKYVGKHRAWIAGFLIVSTITPMFLLLGPGDFWWMTPGMIVIGFGTGSFMALPNSMKADVIDLDTARSGQNRAAFFFSSWSLITKMASSLGGWLALQALAVVGFNAANGAENTPEALMGLQFAYAILPGMIFCGGCHCYLALSDHQNSSRTYPRGYRPQIGAASQFGTRSCRISVPTPSPNSKRTLRRITACHCLLLASDVYAGADPTGQRLEKRNHKLADVEHAILWIRATNGGINHAVCGDRSQALPFAAHYHCLSSSLFWAWSVEGAIE